MKRKMNWRLRLFPFKWETDGTFWPKRSQSKSDDAKSDQKGMKMFLYSQIPQPKRLLKFLAWPMVFTSDRGAICVAFGPAPDPWKPCLVKYAEDSQAVQREYRAILKLAGVAHIVGPVSLLYSHGSQELSCVLGESMLDSLLSLLPCMNESLLATRIVQHVQHPICYGESSRSSVCCLSSHQQHTGFGSIPIK